MLKVNNCLTRSAAIVVWGANALVKVLSFLAVTQDFFCTAIEADISLNCTQVISTPFADLVCDITYRVAKTATLCEND